MTRRRSTREPEGADFSRLSVVQQSFSTMLYVIIRDLSYSSATAHMHVLCG